MTGFHGAAAPEIEEQRKRVVVIGARRGARPELLDWIERVMPVRFEPLGSTRLSAFDGALLLDPTCLADAPSNLPRLVLAADGRRQERGEERTDERRNERRDEHTDERRKERGEEPAATVALAEDDRLPRPLRGRKITDRSVASELTATPRSARDVLASTDDRPLWWQAGEAPALYYSSHPLPVLEPGATLREHLCAGSFMGLLPLLHFLGELLGEEGWKLPAPRAAFVIDDPNLHWSSYGFMNYAELVAHGTRHGYHLALATVPLDGWRAQRRAVALVRENPVQLSLLMHGNDHLARELARLDDAQTAEPAMAQALRRIHALEQRSALKVARVMAPPHGACSEAALAAMFRLGFEAACISRPYPWRDGLPPPTPLAGWHPAELVAGGMPVAPRQPLTAPTEDLPFRALLGHPLILYGHHGDFAKGLDPLAEAARTINDLGEVSWGALEEVAARAYSTRKIDQTLTVRMYARRVFVPIPEGVSAVRVLAQEPMGGAGWQSVEHPGGAAAMSFAGGIGATAALPVEPAKTIQLELLASSPLDPTQVPAPRAKPWPLLRRLLVEGRDRLQPLL